MSRAQGLADELAYWSHVMRTGGGEWPQCWRDCLDPELPLQDEFRELAGTADPVTILDVGAGPSTTVGKVWPGRRLIITAIDPLAREYGDLLRVHRLHAPVPTVYGCAEELDAVEAFDIVHARNSIDHGVSPAAGVANMWRAVKPGGVLVMHHSVNEATKQEHHGLHQWNLYARDGRLMAESDGRPYDLSSLLGDNVAVWTDGQWVGLRARKLTADGRPSATP